LLFYPTALYASLQRTLGWKCGDDLLKEIALRIRVLFHSQHIFRIFGDDFVVLNPLHVSIETAEVLYKLSVGFEGIKITLQHFDFEKILIDSWDSLENYLIHHE
jgi:GGDEF domain-containing protein